MGLKGKKKSLLWNYLLRQNSKWGVSKRSTFFSNSLIFLLRQNSKWGVSKLTYPINIILSSSIKLRQNSKWGVSKPFFIHNYFNIINLLRQNSKWGVSKHNIFSASFFSCKSWGKTPNEEYRNTISFLIVIIILLNVEAKLQMRSIETFSLIHLGYSITLLRQNSKWGVSKHHS